MSINIISTLNKRLPPGSLWATTLVSHKLLRDKFVLQSMLQSFFIKHLTLSTLTIPNLS